MKKQAYIDNVIMFHKPVSIVTLADCTLVSVEYGSGRVRHYFPRIDTIPKRIVNFMYTGLMYPLSATETVYRHGNQGIK